MNPILQTLLPEFILGLGAMALLLFGVLAKRDQSTACTWGAIIGFILAAIAAYTAPTGTIFAGLFRSSDFSRYADMLVLLGAAAALILSLDYNRREGIARFEFPVLVMLAVLGMLVMTSASDLMTLYLGFELQSLALYICAALARDNLRSTEAGLKYFVLGALASGLLIYGISLVYGFAGTTNFAALGNELAQQPVGGLRHHHRHRLRSCRPRLQNLRSTVSYVDSGCVRGRAHARSPRCSAPRPKSPRWRCCISVMLGPFGHLLSAVAGAD